MKFNVSELAAYCNSRKGKADKEGTLWLKERSDGLFSRKACQSRNTLVRIQHRSVSLIAFQKRWFRLLGNLLFYLSSDDEVWLVLSYKLVLKFLPNLLVFLGCWGDYFRTFYN